MLKIFRSHAELLMTDRELRLKHFPATLSLRNKVVQDRIIPYVLNSECEDFEGDFEERWKTLFKENEKHTSFLELVLSNSVFKQFVLQPPLNAHSIKDYIASSHRMFEKAYGEDHLDWCIQADWKLDAPSLVCAIPKKLLATLEFNAQKSKQVLLRIQPRLTRDWNANKKIIPQNAWFVSVSETTMSMLMLEKSTIKQIRQLDLPKNIDKAWLLECVTRESIMFNINTPNTLFIIGEIPLEWKLKSTAIGKAGAFLMAMKNGAVTASANREKVAA